MRQRRIRGNMSRLALGRRIRTYYDKQCFGPNARGRSWDYCNRFFESTGETSGGYKTMPPSTWRFTLRAGACTGVRAFSCRVRTRSTSPSSVSLASSQFSELWQRDIGVYTEDMALAGTIMELVKKVEDEYRKVDAEYKERTGKKPQKNMDLVVTKALLGTLGCLPARDTYFEKGFKAHFKPLRITYGGLNVKFIENILQFCIEQGRKLAELQPEIVDVDDRPYPFMKLVDMYFWQRGAP